MPLFSIVIPTCNRSDLLCETIDSILKQRFTDYEIIVVDDGSTDDTLAKLEKYSSQIKVLKQENRGCAYARNTGIASSTGEYIVGLDSDDLFFPYTLAAYAEIISKHSPSILIGNQLHFNTLEKYNNYKWNEEYIDFIILKDFFSKNLSLALTNSGLIIKRVLLNKVGGYDPDIHASDDYNVLLKLGVESPLVIITSPYTFAYRWHRDNVTSSDMKRVIDGIKALVEKERNNNNPGGKERKFERRAIIGTHSLFWLKQTIIEKRLGFALDILSHVRSMLIIGLIKKLNTKLRRKNKNYKIEFNPGIYPGLPPEHLPHE